MAYSPAAKRETKRIKLPSNGKFWVDIYTKFSWGDRKALRALILEGNDDQYFTVSSDRMALRLIADWNIDDAAGVVLEVTQENLDSLDEDDMQAILDAIAPVISPTDAAEEDKNTKKKTSTSKSAQPLKAEPASPQES